MSDKKEEVKEQQVSIGINNQYIKDLSLEIPFAPEVFKDLSTNPNVDIKIDVDAKNVEGDVYNVALKIEMNADVKEKKLFVLELEYAAIATVNVPKEHLEPILLIEIPRILFPFARSIVTNTLVDGGLPPFMLNPIDFAAIYQAKKQPKN